MSSISRPDASPEVLLMIFSHFNSDTLRTTVAPVCRAWYLAIRHRIIRDVAWDDARKDKELSKVLVGIPGAGRLLWHAHGTNGDLAMEQWRKLQSALSRDYNRRQRGQGHSMKRLMLDNPLLQLELSGNIDIANCLPRIHKYLGSLTCLKLFLTRDCTIDVEPLFRDCLGLEVVHLETTGFLETIGEWVSTAQQTIDGAHPSTQLQLQTLVLWNASVHQANFERFLSMTPRLRRLKCTSMQPRRSESLYWNGGIAYDQTHFYQHVVALPYRLESFHLSFEDGLPAISGFSKSLQVCPISSEWSVDTLDLPLSMMTVLQDQPNHVTTLELVCYSHSERSTQSVLHRYLCQAPHLLHLRAPNIILPVTELDIHGLLTIPRTEPAVTPTSGTDTVQPLSGAAAAVWACRRLRSLQVAFGWGSRESSSVLVQSRVIFGYISRVCSELKELAIYRPDTSEDDVDEVRSSWLDLKGGFCLLSRLEHLERLQIRSGLKEIGCERVDLDWMARSGFVGVRRYVRVLEISNWYDELLEERELMDVDELTVGSRKNREDGLELRYLGRLQDVATRLEELDSVGVVGAVGSRCWPLLSRLSIDCGSEFGRQPERELQRIFG